MNTFNLAGRLTRDIWTNGSDDKAATIAKGTLAVNKPGKDAGADFIPITIIGPAAETSRKYLKKGTQIALTGRLETDTYERDGEKKYATAVITPGFEFVNGTGAAVNNGDLIGRLVRDPEAIKKGDETIGCKFTIAVNRPKRKGEEDKADFLNVVVFGKQHESCLRYLSKGRQVSIDGRLQSDSYKKEDGSVIDRIDVVASRVGFMGDGKKDEEEKKEDDTAEQFAAENPIENLDDIDDLAGIDEEDIPF